MSPLPITGIDGWCRFTPSTVAAIPSRRTEGLNFIAVVRPCTVIICTPTSQSRGGSESAIRQPSSQPSRIFAVTGTATASTTARATATAWAGSQSSFEPPCFLVTLSTGQPMLMSISVAPRASAQRAASARIGGSLPYSCMHTGESSAEVAARHIALSDSRSTLCGHSSSVHASPSAP